MTRRDLLRWIGLGTVAGGALSPSFPHLLAATQRSSPATGVFAPDVELALRAAPGEARILDGAATRVWRFTGTVLKGLAETLQVVPDSYLGPVIRLHRGQKVRVRFANQQNEESIIHWHGLDVPESADGHPRRAVGPGRDYVDDFEVTNRAGTYWYHPHPHMRTGAQAYRGMAGLLLVSDPEEEALALPSGEAEMSTFDATWSSRTGAPIRRIQLSFERMEWSLDGRTFTMNDAAPEETVAAGSTHVWEFVNLENQMMGMQAAHPIHLHGRQFRVIGRTGGRATNALRAGLVDSGWTDTVLVLPGETVRAQVTFTQQPGTYLYHCHILEHEDMGMMRNFRVT
jgi:FtsP/CotA-like multicopper oxidase with cupredoxin domain